MPIYRKKMNRPHFATYSFSAICFTVLFVSPEGLEPSTH